MKLSLLAVLTELDSDMATVSSKAIHSPNINVADELT